MDDPSRLQPERLCAWCGDAIPPWMRKDAETCSTSCRQKRHRFRVAPSSSDASKPMRFAYADPPYPGLARKYYGCEEVDHVELVARLYRDFPDGWALSTSAPALESVLDIIRERRTEIQRGQEQILPKPRVAIWVKGSRPGKAFRARNAWEPLIIVGGRPCELDASEALDDVLLVPTSSRARSHPDALVGMKPAAFSEWMFRLLGAARGDELVDMFKGSGAVRRAWDMFQASPVDARRIPSRLAGATQRLEELQHGTNLEEQHHDDGRNDPGDG